MREVSSKEAQELKAESLFVLGELEDFDRYPMRVHKTGKGIFIESLRVDEDHPHVFFDDPIEYQHWFAALQGRTYAGPRKPRSASEALGILDLYEAPDFPDNVPPLIRDVIERKRIELDFSVAALTELEAALQRKRAVHLGTKGIGYVVLYFGETLRRDVGGTWVVEDSRYGQELRIRAPSGKVIDFALDLGHSLDEPGPTTFMWYFRMCKERIR